jgi:hypothetical protein
LTNNNLFRMRWSVYRVKCGLGFTGIAMILTFTEKTAAMWALILFMIALHQVIRVLAAYGMCKETTGIVNIVREGDMFAIQNYYDNSEKKKKRG